MKAVIDRFEGDYAVILVGSEEIKVDLPKKLLPLGAKEGSWLNLRLEIDSGLGRAQETKIRALLDKLKNKPR